MNADFFYFSSLFLLKKINFFKNIKEKYKLLKTFKYKREKLKLSKFINYII